MIDPASPSFDQPKLTQTLGAKLKASVSAEAHALETQSWAWLKAHAVLAITFVMGVVVGAMLF